MDKAAAPLDQRSRPQRHAQVLVQRADAEVLLLGLHSGHYYALDEVGGRVWELCDGTRTVRQIASELAQEYDAPADEITADVLALLMDLVGERLVVVD